MTTIAAEVRERAGLRLWANLRFSPWTLVLCSRLIALAAGIAGASLVTRAPGWEQFDPERITTSLGHIGNVLAASSDRWDAEHYIGLAQHGYTTAASTVFFPLYPILIHVVGWVIPSYVLAGVMISATCFAIALNLLRRLTRELLGERAARATLLLLAFAPLSFFFTAVYTESLFLALSVGTFYFARRERFLLASIAAACTTLTHLEGLALELPLALMFMQSRGVPARWRGLLSWSVLPLALPVLAFGGFMLYLHSRGYGWLAPMTNEHDPAYAHQFTGPVIAIARAVQLAVTGIWQTLHGTEPVQAAIVGPFSMPAQNLVYLGVVGICIAALVEAWHRLPKVFAVYSALMLCLCTSSPVIGDPLHSVDRYALVLFPLWMAAGAKLSELRLTSKVVLISALALCFYAFEFGAWVFIA